MPFKFQVSESHLLNYRSQPLLKLSCTGNRFVKCSWTIKYCCPYLIPQYPVMTLVEVIILECLI